MKKAIFPGSFDPFTIGHKDIVEQASNIFDEIIIAVGKNPSKSCMFSLNDRISFIKKSLGANSKIKIESYSELTISFCKSNDIEFLIRGLRNVKDFLFEKDIKNMQETFSNVKSIYFISGPNFSFVSRSLIRDILKHGGKCDHLLRFKLNH